MRTPSTVFCRRNSSSRPSLSFGASCATFILRLGRCDRRRALQPQHSQQRLSISTCSSTATRNTRGSSRSPSACSSGSAWRSDLDALVSDSRNTVHSNYFIAKPRFWRAWLAINEQMFAIAETPSDALGEALRTPTRYRGGSNVQMKIFVMERVATWLLITRPKFRGAGARSVRRALADLQAAASPSCAMP